jgi:hypothetical protein
MRTRPASMASRTARHASSMLCLQSSVPVGAGEGKAPSDLANPVRAQANGEGFGRASKYRSNPLFCLRTFVGQAIECGPRLEALDEVLRNLIQNPRKLNQKVK